MIQNNKEMLYFTEKSLYSEMIQDRKFGYSAGFPLMSFLLFTNPCGGHHEKVILLLLLLFSVNIYVLTVHTKAIINYHRSQLWETTIATITQINIIPIQSGFFSFNPSVLYKPHIRYTYKTNGEIFQGERLSFDPEGHKYTLNPEMSNQYHPMNHLFSQWVEDKKVTIRYNPLNPSESVIFNEFEGAKWSYRYHIFVSIYASITLCLALADFICMIIK